MDHVMTRAGRVAYRESGDPAGVPVVLLHSAGHDHHDYDAIVPALAARHRVIAVDWPGFGESDVPEAATVCAGLYFDVLEDIVDRLGIPPAVFIGNSVGGAAAVRLAGRRPDRVLALIPVDFDGFAIRHPLVRAFCWLQGRHWVRRRFGVRFARWYMKRRTSEVAAILARLAAANRGGSLATHAALWRSFTRPASGIEIDARQVGCPTLVVWGRRDPVTRLSVEGARARAAIPGASWAVLDTGHVPFAEAPEEFLAHALPFLARVTASPAA